MIASTTRRPRTAKLKLDDTTSFARSRVLPEYRHMSDSMLQWLADAPGRRTSGRALIRTGRSPARF
jgi:hypothetical protein